MKHRHKGPKIRYKRKGKTHYRKRPNHIHLTFSDGRKRKVPFMKPMRPKPTDKVMKGREWIAEEKKDGSLTLQYAYDGSLAYANRRGVDKTSIYPELSDKEKLNTKGLTITQGETYALKGRKDNFDAFLRRDLLQDPVKARKRMRKYPLKYEAFDIIMKDNKWLTGRPLRERKDILDKTMPKGQKDIKVTPYHRNTVKFTRRMKKDKTVEGVVYKDLNSKYKSGKQKDWLKKKFRKSADTFIMGYNKGKGKRSDIGTLNVGVWDTKTKQIREVGRVGTGFTDKELKDIKGRLDKGERLFSRTNYLNVGSRGRLRGLSFGGLREDILLGDTHV